MPEQSEFLGFAAARADVATLEKPYGYLNLERPLEVTGGDQILPLAGVDSATRQINIQAIGETIGAGTQWDGRKVWIVSHGFNGWYRGFVYGDEPGSRVNPFLSIPQQIKQSNPDDIVLTVDWRQAASVQIPGLTFPSDANDAAGLASSMNYFAATWIGPVAEKVAEQLVAWGVDPGSLNLIGHSLGAYLSAEIAYQVKSKSPTAEKVGSLTMLDPASDYNPPNLPLLTALGYSPLLPLIDIGRYQNGYVYSRTGVGDVHPPSPQDVAEYSRAFLGRTSIAGSVEASAEAAEAFLMDFGPGSGTDPRQHLNVALTFKSLIDSTRPNLAGDLLELSDNRPHPEFQQNVFVANDILQRQVFEGVLLVDAPNVIKGFYAKRANADGYFIYGTDGDDQVSMSFFPTRVGLNVPRLNGRSMDAGFAFGNNIYNLGAGSDTLRASRGDDFIYGDFTPSDSAQTPKIGMMYDDTIDAGAGDDQVFGNLGNDKLSGNTGDDLLCGDSPNTLEGGDDRIFGNDGNDLLRGGVGQDRLFGNNGNDILFGDDGDDILSGSDGPARGEIDTLTGGAGADIFVLKRGYREDGVANYVNLMDFNPDEGDKIQLSDGRENYSFKQQNDDVQVYYHEMSQPLDIVLLTDLTKSFRSELTTVKQLMPALVEKLQASYQDTRLGFSSFTDVVHDWDSSNTTREKYGELKKVGKDRWGYDQYVIVERTRTSRYSSSYYEWGYTYSPNINLTDDLPVPLEAINRAAIHLASLEGTFTYGSPETGYTSTTKLVDRDDLDPKESQLDALLETARDPAFRDKATRIAIITTDSPFHQVGDGRKEVLGDWFKSYGQTQDYTSIAELRSALTAANVVPIFAVTKSVQGIYSDLVEQLGRGAVVTLSSNPNKLMNAISDAIEGDLVGVVHSTTVGQVLAQSRYVA